MTASWHFLHIWSSWKDIERGEIAVQGTQGVGNYLIQERVCEMCGKKQLRAQSVRI